MSKREPPATSSAQYDRIVDTYAKLYPPNLTTSLYLPARLEEEQFKHALLRPDVNLKGKKVLDLAGGNGYYSFRWLAWGAASVTCCDISEGMIERGRAAAQDQAVGERQMRFVVADAGSLDLKLPGAPFDLVTAAWLLNYAPDFQTLERMWTNIGKQLRPGGVFVGLTTPPLLTDLPFERDLLNAAYSAEGVWGRYGTCGRVLGKTAAGYKVQTELGISAQGHEIASFENFHTRKEVIEDALSRTGLFEALEWADWVVSPELRKEYPDLADDATLLPHCRTMFVQELVSPGIFRTIVITILTISLVVFVALFGRLPVFRRTPIAFLHKLFTKYLPNAFIWVDSYLTGRRLSRALFSTGHYLMYEKHPIVLIFFVGLQTLGEVAIIPQLWPTLAFHHKLIIPGIILLPHYFLYLCATTSSSIPLPPNHAPQTSTDPASPNPSPPNLDFGPAHTAAMHAYPYDYLLYHPGYFCTTCHFPKPARSKHCSLCRACVQKQDHHCIWVNNCVGRNNYLPFLQLLLAITAVLVYGVSLGWTHMAARLHRRFGTSWSAGTTWEVWFDRLAWALVADVRIGATTLLCAMCTPLGAAFLAYHAYLLWAGMTTNEQAKWADWKEDVRDDVVFRANIDDLRHGVPSLPLQQRHQGSSSAPTDDPPLAAYPPLPREIEPSAHDVDWPPCHIPRALWEQPNGKPSFGRAEWWYVRTRHGDQPTVKVSPADARRCGLTVLPPESPDTAYPNGEAGEGSVSKGAGKESGSKGKGKEEGKMREVDVEDPRWRRVLSFRREMDNVYDLGMWGNLMESIYHRER